MHLGSPKRICISVCKYIYTCIYMYIYMCVCERFSMFTFNPRVNWYIITFTNKQIINTN